MAMGYKTEPQKKKKIDSVKLAAGKDLAVAQHKSYKGMDRKAAQAPVAKSKAAAAKKKETTYDKDKRLFGTPGADYLKANPSKAKSTRLSWAQQNVITDNARRQQAAAKKSKQTGPVKEKGAIKRRTK